MEFVSSAEEMKIDIIGHSCGLADRSLLRELFQNNSIQTNGIRVYHHNGKESYSNLVYGISRIFEENIEMRDKVQNFNTRLAVPKLFS